MAPEKKITREQEKAVVAHRELGLPNIDIAEQLGLSESACSKIWKAHLNKALGLKRLEIAYKASDKVNRALDHTDVTDKEDRQFIEKVWKDSMPEQQKVEVNTQVNVGIALFSKEDEAKAHEMFEGRILDAPEED